MNKLLLAFGIVLTIIAGLFFYLYTGGPEQPADSAVNNTDEIAHVRRFIPDVTVYNIDVDSVISVDQALFNGDTLFTNTNGYAMLLFIDESIAKVTPNSQMIIEGTLSEDRQYNLRTFIELTAGSLFFDIQKEAGSEFEITTSQTVASVKGTRFGINSDNLIWMEEGEVEVLIRETGEVVNLQQSMYLKIDEETGEMESGELTEEKITELNITELEDDFSILDYDVIEQQMRLQFRDRNGNTQDENLKFYEQEEQDN